jgi:hypothetical protein
VVEVTEDLPTEERGGHDDEGEKRHTEASGDPEQGLDRETVLAYLQWGALFAFGVLALVAGAGIYGALGAIVDVWVADRYQPIARVGVNLALLCVAVAGAVATMRRIDRAGED